MVPQPVKAVMLLFPVTDETERRSKEEDAALAGREAPKGACKTTAPASSLRFAALTGRGPPRHAFCPLSSSL